ncbi:MAG: hypothetical protein ABFD83_02740 [Armatimonadota bacterium]
MIKCPKCNWENRDDVVKCVLCAYDFNSAAVASPPLDPVMNQPAVATYQPQPNPNTAVKLSVYDAAIKSGGNWFYWIAGLSLINTVVALAGMDWGFVIGLGFTLLLDMAIREYGGYATIILLPINLIIVGMYVVFGYFACRRARWAFITGIILYGLDTLLVIVARDWLMIAFHAFALFCVGRGLQAVLMARKAEAADNVGVM